MGNNLKQKLLDVAELADAYRLVPRLILIGYGWLMVDMYFWFINLAEPTTQQAGFVSTIVGVASVITGFYLKTGRDWTNK